MSKTIRKKVVVEFEWGCTAELIRALNQIKCDALKAKMYERILLPGGIYTFDQENIEEQEVRQEEINGKMCIVIKSRL